MTTGLRSALPLCRLLPMFNQAIPTNDANDPIYAITLLNQGNLYLTLSVAPNNPNIVYLGSFGDTTDMVAETYNGVGSDTGLIRIDTTNIFDSHNVSDTTYIVDDGGAGDAHCHRRGVF